MNTGLGLYKEGYPTLPFGSGWSQSVKATLIYAPLAVYRYKFHLNLIFSSVLVISQAVSIVLKSEPQWSLTVVLLFSKKCFPAAGRKQPGKLYKFYIFV